MLRSHRRWHRMIWLILGPAIIALAAAALVKRSPAPVDHPDFYKDLSSEVSR